VADDAAVFHQPVAVTDTLLYGDGASGSLLAENRAQLMMDRQWQRQQLEQLHSELSTVDSRIGHLRTLMDLARSVRSILNVW